MDSMGNRLRRAFDLRPLPPRKKTTTSNRKNFSSTSRRAGSLDALGGWRQPHETVSDSMFGGMIRDSVDETTSVNKFVQWCIDAIETTGEGLKTDGIYRVTAGQVGAKRISWKAERSIQRVLEREGNVHVLTAALKLFFRSLKQPIMHVEDFQTALQPHFNDVETAELLRQAVRSLPLAERSTLAYLFLHLRRVVDTEENKMTVATLSACFGPTLLRLRTELAAQASMAKDMKEQNHLVGQLLLHCDIIFGAARAATVTAGQVTDCARDDKLDTSSVTSDEAETDSPTKKVLIASVANQKRNSSLSANDSVFRDNTDSSSSDEADTHSPMKVLITSADHCKRNSTLSANNKESVLRDKVDSSSSDKVKKDSPTKKQVLITSADNYTTHSALLANNKESVPRDKVDSSSSDKVKKDIPTKKQVLITSADNYTTHSTLLANNKESVLRDKIESSSSDASERDSRIKKRLFMTSADNYKRNSTLSTNNKDSVLRDKTDSSSSDEAESDSPMKKRVLIASVDNYKRNSTLSENNKESVSRDKINSSSSDKVKLGSAMKQQLLIASAGNKNVNSALSVNHETVFRDKIDSSSSDEAKLGSPPPKQQLLIASAGNYMGDSSLSAHQETVFRDKIDSSPSDKAKLGSSPPPKQPILIASAGNYMGNSSSANQETMFRGKIDSSSSDEKEHNTTKKVKQAFSARTIMKKMRNKLFPSRGAAENKRKSLTSDDDKQLTLSEIDALSVKLVKTECDESSVPPPTMTTFKFSFEEHSDAEQKIKQPSISEVGPVKKAIINSTENKKMVGLTRRQISSSSSSEDDDKEHSTINNSKKLAAGEVIIATIKQEPTNLTEVKNTPVLLQLKADYSSVEDYSKPATQVEHPTASVTKLIKGGTAHLPPTKMKIPPQPPKVKHDSVSSGGEKPSISATQMKLPLASEIIEVTERTPYSANTKETVAALNVKKDTAKVSAVDYSKQQQTDIGCNKDREQVYASSVTNHTIPKNTFTQSTQDPRNDVKKQELKSEAKLESNLNISHNDKQKHGKRGSTSSSSSNEGNSVIDRNVTLVAASFLDGVPKPSNQHPETDVIYENISFKAEPDSKQILRSHSPSDKSCLVASTTAYSSSTFTKPKTSLYTDYGASTTPLIASKDLVPETKGDVIYATLLQVKPSTAMVPPDIFKPTPTLTEVFNSNSIQSINYAPPLDSGHQTNNSIVPGNSIKSSISSFKPRESTSSSSGESFSDSSDDYVSTIPPPATSSWQFQPVPASSAAGIKANASVPTAL